MTRHRRRGIARIDAYLAQEALVSAVRVGAHPRKISKLLRRALRSWRAAARLHGRGYDRNWRRVALFHGAALVRGVVDAGCVVPYVTDARQFTGSELRGAAWVHAVADHSPHCKPALLLDGSEVC